MKEKIDGLREQAKDLEERASLLEAYSVLREASHLEWRAREMLGFPNDMLHVCRALDKAKHNIAIKLGHSERAEKLIQCGMTPEFVEGCNFVDDDTAAACLATWLFDQFGLFEYLSDASDYKQDYQGVFDKVSEIFPLGLEFYKTANHDT
jgi:hypothetical protein